ncbi:phosphoglycolate phosphatase [Chthonobacter rhizosphaerae]|uniref:phosphoglycolate phosphatase n=1 Tax=Chthonobacter rhizosphaerae TaxID=2735553 RepID=UPI0015EFAACF|nr:phosphoglycolate phosphatase [Chthonobacter rhizosphaerae]
MGAPRPAGILFDLDGTLVDSLPDIADALGDLMVEHSLPRHPADAVRRMIGKGVAVLVERAFAAHGANLPADDRRRAVDRYLALYEPRALRDTRLFPHVEDAVRALAAAGHRLGVCTNKPTAVSREIVAGFGLADVLPVVIGGDFGPPRKPAPDLLVTAAEHLRVSPADMLMVGDSASDVEAARAAGMPVIVVEYGYTDVSPADLGADRLIGDFAGLSAAIRSLYGEV